MSQELEWEWMPCLGCESPDTQRVFSVKRRSRLFTSPGEIEFHYEQCLQCGLIYLNPRFSLLQMRKLYPDAHPAGDPLPANPSDAWPPNHLGLAYWYRDLFVRPVDKLPVARERALDYVCRGGLFLRLLKERYGWREVYGCDPRPSWVEAARDVATEAFSGSIEEAEFPCDFFDLVTLRHTLEHVYNPIFTLGEVRRVLMPGGFLRVEVPNVVGVGSLIFRRHWVGLFPPRHLYQFSAKTVCQLLERTGFEVHDISCTPWPYYLAGTLEETMKRTPGIGGWYRHITGSKAIQYALAASLYSFFLPISTIAALLKMSDEVVVTARARK